MSRALLDVHNLRVSVGTGPDGAGIEAVHGVSFSVGRGETVGLVGESGSGKTTIGRAIQRLLQPSGGSITLDGTDITHLSRR